MCGVDLLVQSEEVLLLAESKKICGVELLNSSGKRKFIGEPV
jgi:hypothetical protein